jgi:hypothetical protein
MNYAGNHFFPLEFPDFSAIIIMVIPAERRVAQGVEIIKNDRMHHGKFD